MFAISVDRAHNVPLVEFSGTLTDADLSDAEAGVLAFQEKEGLARRIMDLTAVMLIDIPDKVLVERARSRPVNAANTIARVYVVPTAYLFGICRLFTSYQAAQGVAQPPIVRSRSEAYVELHLSEPDFQPI